MVVPQPIRCLNTDGAYQLANRDAISNITPEAGKQNPPIHDEALFISNTKKACRHSAGKPTNPVNQPTTECARDRSSFRTGHGFPDYNGAGIEGVSICFARIGGITVIGFF